MAVYGAISIAKFNITDSSFFPERGNSLKEMIPEIEFQLRGS
jgi:hypothetical protein